VAGNDRVTGLRQVHLGGATRDWHVGWWPERGLGLWGGEEPLQQRGHTEEKAEQVNPRLSCPEWGRLSPLPLDIRTPGAPAPTLWDTHPRSLDTLAFSLGQSVKT
jgi:hypothetical protein